MENLSYILEDVEKAQKENLESFSIPSFIERRNLEPGQIVKLIFLIKLRKEGDPRAERMWVKIVEAVEENYHGFLDSDPVYLGDLKAGDLIKFKVQNIASIYKN